MPMRSRAFARQKLCLDFTSVKHAAPQGVYVAPVPEEPLLWTGVMFLRKGPYANAILRFQISFPEDWPDRAPIITFLQDVFHPLVTPLTTYTYSTRERGTDTVSAADQEKLPPGGLVLREGFPEWFGGSASTTEARESEAGGEEPADDKENTFRPPHIVEVLHYLRLAFSVPEILDEVPLASAANPSAWHAWRSHRAKYFGERARSPIVKSPTVGSVSEASEGSLSPQSKQQPGGARRPGEWNWTGVWEERVRKVVHTSRAESALFGGEAAGVIDFAKMDDEAIASIVPQMEARVGS